ncbi:Uncharacterised protein [Vibrio cholerae]|nr:Uncharacterised protein [Vibrio cholerae]
MSWCAPEESGSTMLWCASNNSRKFAADPKKMGP